MEKKKIKLAGMTNALSQMVRANVSQNSKRNGQDASDQVNGTANNWFKLGVLLCTVNHTHTHTHTQKGPPFILIQIIVQK